MFRDTSGQDRVLDTGSTWTRWRWPLIGGGAAIALLVWLLPGYVRLWSAEQSVSLSRVSIAVVERARFERDIAADGRVIAAVSPSLYAAASGTVHFDVKAGHQVEAGQAVGTLESPELQSELAREKAQLQALTADYERARLDVRQQAVLADDALQQAQVDRDAAATEHARMTQAFELGVTPEIELMRTDAALRKAEFALVRAKSERALQREGQTFDVDAKRLARDAQALIVQELARQVELLTLRSPVSGQVGQLLTTDRAFVVKDAPLMTIVDLSALEVEVAVPESFARDLAVGMPARIRGNGQHYDGEVSAVSPEVVSGQVTARVRFADAPPPGLRQNQRLSVRVLLDARDDVLMVDRGPFLEAGGGRVAYVVAGDVAERRAIRTGAVSIDKVEILDGISAGERLVISGTDSFDDAQRVVLSD